MTGPAGLRVLAGPDLAKNAAHEMCHAVSLHANPGFANNPRWLWEAVALYENREFVDPRMLEYLVRGAPPTLQQLYADVNSSRQVYDVGYLLGEFVVARGGRGALVRLVQTNGGTASVLGLTPDAFTQVWYDFVRERYLS